MVPIVSYLKLYPRLLHNCMDDIVCVIPSVRVRDSKIKRIIFSPTFKGPCSCWMYGSLLVYFLVDLGAKTAIVCFRVYLFGFDSSYF